MLLARSFKNRGVACIYFPQSVIVGKGQQMEILKSEFVAKYIFFIYKVCLILAISDIIQNEILNGKSYRANVLD